MNFTQSFKLAIKSLLLSKMRALLTMLGIIIGVASVIVILALGNGVQGMVDEQVEKLGVNMMQTYVWGRGDGSTMDLDPDDMYQLVEEHPEVLTGVSPYVSFQATLRRGDEKFDKTQLYGVSEVMFKNETQATMDGGQKLTSGRFLSFLDVERRNNVCVIGAYLAQEAFQGDALGRTLSINGTSYTVIGVLDQLSTSEMLKGGPDDQIYIPYENALELMGARYVTLYIFTSTSGETAAQAKEVIDSMLYDRFQGDTDAYFTQTMEEQANLINAMMGVAIGVLVAIAAISLEMLARLQATESDAEDIAAFVGQVEGVRTGVTIRELKPGLCKISLRTDPDQLNASTVCALLGGGGHAAASGATVEGDIQQTKEVLMAAIRQIQGRQA